VGKARFTPNVCANLSQCFFDLGRADVPHIGQPWGAGKNDATGSFPGSVPRPVLPSPAESSFASLAWSTATPLRSTATPLGSCVCVLSGTGLTSGTPAGHGNCFVSPFRAASILASIASSSSRVKASQHFRLRCQAAAEVDVSAVHFLAGLDRRASPPSSKPRSATY
jgi:hypothetical protein